MSNVRKSLAISFADKYSAMAIQFVSSVILARLLSPHEIGIFSVGSVIVGFAHTLRDFGVTNYLIQERELTGERMRSAQGLTLVIAWSLAIVLAFASGPIADFYREPGVRQTVLVLCLNFIMLPFGSITAALLRRDLNFGALYRLNFVSALAQAATSVTMAYFGWGFISLAWGGLASVATATFGSLFYRTPGQPWLPGFSESRRVLTAGSQFSAASLLNEVGLGGPELVTGRLLGVEAVGYLSRAFGTALLFQRAVIEAISPVATPFFAARIRAENNLGELYPRSLALISGLAFPMYATLAIAADPVIRVLYGDQWSEAIAPTSIICIGMALRSLTSIASSAVIADGRVRANLVAQVWGQCSKLLFVAVGALSGIAGACWGIVAGETVLLGAYALAARDSTGMSLPAQASAMVGSLGLGALAALTTSVAMKLTVDHSHIAQLAAVTIASVSTWIAAVYVARHPLSIEVSHQLGRFWPGIVK